MKARATRSLLKIRDLLSVGMALVLLLGIMAGPLSAAGFVPMRLNTAPIRLAQARVAPVRLQPVNVRPIGFSATGIRPIGLQNMRLGRTTMPTLPTTARLGELGGLAGGYRFALPQVSIQMRNSLRSAPTASVSVLATELGNIELRSEHRQALDRLAQTAKPREALQPYAQALERLSANEARSLPTDQVVKLAAGFKKDLAAAARILKASLIGSLERNDVAGANEILKAEAAEQPEMRVAYRQILAKADPNYLGPLHGSDLLKRKGSAATATAPAGALLSAGTCEVEPPEDLLLGISEQMWKQPEYTQWTPQREEEYQSRVRDFGARATIDLCEEFPEMCRRLEPWKLTPRLYCRWHCRDEETGAFIQCHCG